MQAFHVHPINLIKAFSMALELALTGMTSHHWRTAVISKKIAEAMRLEEPELRRVVYAALLHDIGAAADWDERRLLKQLGSMPQADVYKHAEIGYALLRDSSVLGELAGIVRCHHDRWRGGNPSGLSGAQIPLASRIVHLADRIEVALQDSGSYLLQRRRILAGVRCQCGEAFDPQIVEIWEACAKREAFWLDLVEANYHQPFFEELRSYGMVPYSFDDAIRLAETFATIIDKTSAFTASHSRSVARVATFLAALQGFSPDECKAMRIAALLHDLGKLAISNEILEKPGKLTEEEMDIVRQHTYYTYRILSQIDHFGVIAEWAAYHHETLDGTGYPFRIGASSLSLGARIVAVADVFVALSEDRPYRKGMSGRQVADILSGMAAACKLDAKLVAALLAQQAAAQKMLEDSGRRASETDKSL